MKSLIAAAFIATLGLGAAQAMPLAPMQADGLTTQVAEGCGPGMTRNREGRCRPKFMARECRPGMHRNRFGVCRPN